jgi:phosphoenolpyruvate carboxykinase (GTP)
VNWFRLDENGKFIWPGFGDNARVLKWIVDRVNNRVGARETPLGLIPNIKDLTLEGLSIPADGLEKLFEINPGEWQPELRELKEFLSQFRRHIPYEIWQEYDRLAARLNGSK